MADITNTELAQMIGGLDKKFVGKFDSLDAKIDGLAENMSAGFTAIDERFDRLETKVDSLEAEVRGVKRLGRKNSSDIAELQAAQGV